MEMMDYESWKKQTPAVKFAGVCLMLN